MISTWNLIWICLLCSLLGIAAEALCISATDRDKFSERSMMMACKKKKTKPEK